MSAEPFASDRQRLEAACATAASSGDPRLPLLRAAADGRIALGWVTDPSAAWPLEAVRANQMPAVFLVGDDPWPNGEACGPRGWALSFKLKAWLRSAIVHGAGGEPEHYREAVVAATYTGRCAFIETSSRRASLWARYLDCPATLLIVPKQGVVHPSPANIMVRH